MAIKFDTFKTGGAASGVTSVNGASGVVTISGDDLAADHTAVNYSTAGSNIDDHFSGIDTKLGTIAAGLTYKGSYNASTNSPALTNALQGDLYVVSAAGTQFGVDWQIGDHLLVNADMGGTIDNAKIDKIDNTEPAASETVAGIIQIATDTEAADGTATNKALVPSNIASLDLANMDNTTAGFISSVASASETVEGIIEIATNAEAAAGAATNKALVPSNIASLDLSAMDNTTSGFISSVASASESVQGIIEIATNAEAAAASATDRALVPSNIASLDLADMDNTTSAFISNINSESLNDLSDVNFTAGSSINGYVLKYDHGNTRWQAEAESSAAAASETVAGVIEIATNGEAALGAATNKALVPSNIASLDLSAMDNTTSGFIHNIDSESLNDLSDVNFTAGSSINGYVLKYDHGNTRWQAEAESSAAAASETVAGVIEIATNAEAAAASATNKALVPSNISSLDLSAMDNTTSGFIANLSEDSTPSLGGPLDVAGQDIVSVSNGDIELAANGTGTVKITPTTSGGHLVLQGDGTNSGKLVLNCQLNSHGVTIEGPPHSANANYTLTLPNNDGDADQVLKTDGSGALSWVDQPAGASAASETVAGVIEIATNPEAAAGTATNKALVPSNIASLNLSDMDNTTAGFIAGITGESLNDLSDVSYTAGAGIDNYVLTYDHSTTSWGAEAAAGGGWTYSAITADPANAQAGYHYSCTGTFTITLPTSGVTAGAEIRIKNMGTGTITIDPQTQNIDGATTDYTLDVQYSAITLVSTGSHWEII